MWCKRAVLSLVSEDVHGSGAMELLQHPSLAWASAPVNPPRDTVLSASYSPLLGLGGAACALQRFTWKQQERL